MDNEQLINILNNIIQADIDAYYIAQKGVDNVESDEVIAYLADLQHNHEQRIKDLSAIVQNLGGTPPAHQDLKGYALEGVVALSGLLEQKVVLQCIRSAEEIVSSSYNKLKEATESGSTVPINIKYLLDRYWTDQQQCLKSMEKLLEAA